MIGYQLVDDVFCVVCVEIGFFGKFIDGDVFMCRDELEEFKVQGNFFMLDVVVGDLGRYIFE